MKFFALAFALLCWGNTLSGQTFFPVPGPVLEKELAYGQANECYIFFDNPSGDTLQLRWRIFSESKPAEWTIDLCDYGLCYTGIPPNGTMNPVYDTIQPYLKLIVQPDSTPGSAWLWFRVFEKDNPDNFMEVYFSLFTPGTTATREPEKLNFDVFPNPASDLLVVENKSSQTEWATLMNTTGIKIWERPVAPGEQNTIDVRPHPGGTYFLINARQIQQILIQR